MSTLYRKYRPQLFADVVDQEHVVKTLENEIASGSIAHSYLFYGPRGTGKTSLARLLAKAANCPNRKPGEHEPCSNCASCTSIAAGRSIDVIEIDAASQTGVDNVRENIIDNARFQPTMSPYKVFIIDEVHMLSTNAFNALLKTLEEPPAYVIFILATTELHKLPATVVSRCQRFSLRKIPYETMRARLQRILKEEGRTVDEAVLHRVIRKSDGCLRDAESLLGQLLALDLPAITAKDADIVLPTADTETVLTYLEQLFARDTAVALATLTTLADAGQSLDHFALGIIELVRALLLLKATRDLGVLTADYSDHDQERLKKLAAQKTEAELVTLLDRVLARRAEIKSSPLPALPLELFTIESTQAPLPTAAGTLPTTPAAAPPTSATASPASSSAPSSGQPGPAPAAGATARTEPAPTATTPPSRLGTSLKSALSTITGHYAIATPLETVQKQWNGLTDKVAAISPSLNLILKTSSPVRIDTHGLHIQVSFPFHRDKLDESKNKKIIETALHELFQEKIPVNFELKSVETAPLPAPENTSTSLPMAEAVLSSLAAEFGGEVVG